MNVKVAKFGGTSMANAKTIRRVASIIDKDPLRAFIVVSAPGKRSKEDIKVTDLLIILADEILKEGTATKYQPVIDRFMEIATGLHIVKEMRAKLDETLVKMMEVKTREFIVSRGEYLAAFLLATYLEYEFMDSAEIIRFKRLAVDYKETEKIARRALKHKMNVVLGGFYGATASGDIRLLTRGGSDVSGALIAGAINAKVYENWTDVDGFLVTDPKIVVNPRLIESMTYKELRVLSFMGANILHSDTFFPVAKKGIPINVRNTFNLKCKGTMIYASAPYRTHSGPVTGIAGLKDFTLVVVEKELLSEMVGIDRKILAIPEKLDINVEHFPSGTDTFSMLIESRYLTEGKLDELVAQLKKTIKPDFMEVTEKIALISIIGRHLMANNFNMLRLFTALVNDNITIKMIDYGSSSGVNIVVGVNEEDYEYAIIAIYKEFVEDEEKEAWRVFL